MRSLSGPKRRRIEPQSALFTREKAAKGALGASVYAYERRWDKTYQRGYELPARVIVRCVSRSRGPFCAKERHWRTCSALANPTSAVVTPGTPKT